MAALRSENIAPLVRSLRGERVLFDADLAALYREWSAIRSQTVTASTHSMMSQIATSSRRKLGAAPYAFTEQGVAMLSSVLRSLRAVEVNIAIMRTLVQLRRLMDSNRQLARKIEALEKKYDEQFAVVFDAIKRLIAEENAGKAPRRPIGFVS